MAQRLGTVGVERAEQRALRRPQLDRALERERGARGRRRARRRADPSAATMRRCAAASARWRGRARPLRSGRARRARAARSPPAARRAPRRLRAQRPGSPRAGLVVGVGAPPLAAAGRRERVEGRLRRCMCTQNQTGGGARRARRRGARAAARTRCSTLAARDRARRAHDRQRRAARRRRRAAAACAPPPAATALLSQLANCGQAWLKIDWWRKRPDAKPFHCTTRHSRSSSSREHSALPQRRELVGGAAVRRSRARARGGPSGATGGGARAPRALPRAPSAVTMPARGAAAPGGAPPSASGSGASTRSSSPGSRSRAATAAAHAVDRAERDRAHEFGGCAGHSDDEPLAVLARLWCGTVISAKTARAASTAAAPVAAAAAAAMGGGGGGGVGGVVVAEERPRVVHRRGCRERFVPGTGGARAVREEREEELV